MPEPASKRLLWIVAAALGAGALLLWGSSRLAWTWQLRLVPGGGPVAEERTGAEQETALVPLAVLAVAAVAAAVATGGWPRRLVGVLVVLAGLAALWAVAHELGGVFGDHPPDYPTARLLLGRTLAALGGLSLLTGGVLLVRAAATLPRLGAAYSAPGTARRPADEDRRLWEALSEGEDPTVDR
ncbi:MAG: Trp biosynthesis-associated membrane protein [Sciscionella sp.]